MKSENDSIDKSKKVRVNNLSYLKKYRQKLRNNLTPAEATLWRYIKDKKLDGRKFRRQHSIGKFILDFYCPSEKLAIELDGNRHFDNVTREFDIDRTAYLSKFEIRVLRFENKTIFEEMDWVIGHIRSNFGWRE
ncbi:MAG: endonuclease domain-containing protein [Pyrinomonadaceae bacterium]